jgi:hypothetical protein
MAKERVVGFIQNILMDKAGLNSTEGAGRPGSSLIHEHV